MAITQLEVGKIYVNKKGKQSIIQTTKPGDEDFPYTIYVDQKGFEFIYDGTEVMNGSYMSSSNNDNLIAEV